MASRRWGYFVEMNPFFTKEADTSTCAHCQQVTFLKPQPGGVIINPARCGCCHGALCEQCYGKMECRPIERWLEQQEARGKLLTNVLS